jgi:hypothetical protein
MFLGGAYHDCDTPQFSGVSQGKPIVSILLVWSSSRRWVRTLVDDEMMRMLFEDDLEIGTKFYRMSQLLTQNNMNNPTIATDGPKTTMARDDDE